MANHKFRVGEQVELISTSMQPFAAVGPYEVVSQLPDISGELGYRIKSASEPHERAVPESRIRRLGSETLL
jgi:hypothetical protein